MAIFFAFFFRNSNDDKEAKEYIDENQIDLNNDEEYLHSNKVCLFVIDLSILKNDYYRMNLYLLIDLQYVQIV